MLASIVLGIIMAAYALADSETSASDPTGNAVETSSTAGATYANSDDSSFWSSYDTQFNGLQGTLNNEEQSYTNSVQTLEHNYDTELSQASDDSSFWTDFSAEKQTLLANYHTEKSARRASVADIISKYQEDDANGQSDTDFWSNYVAQEQAVKNYYGQ